MHNSCAVPKPARDHGPDMTMPTTSFICPLVIVSEAAFIMMNSCSSMDIKRSQARHVVSMIQFSMIPPQVSSTTLLPIFRMSSSTTTRKHDSQ
ncbi:uncharacterized protein BDW70DRAFT_154793 [Aspergillus foveolatus]|uniref:uncharacterized protein n=1 Tax=Aspergillus foveolatus TaxID=210207 RepID=UPI003CCDA741